MFTFEGRLTRFWSQLDPEAQEGRLRRITSIGGLPGLDDLPAHQRIDINKLLKLRDSTECQELRRWLRQVDGETDEQMDERFKDVREKLASITHSRTGKTIRFLVDNGVGAIPVVGIAAGPAATLLDKFIVDKLIGEPGPISFLGHAYPSIFMDGKLDDQ
jgi:hypothetical protein